MPKLLFIIPEFPPAYGGGIGTFYGHLLPALASSGAEVTAIVGSGLHSCSDLHQYDGLTIVPIDQQLIKNLRDSFSSLSLSPDLTSHLAAAWAAWRQANEGEGFDIVECTDWGLFFVPWLLSTSNPPLVIRLHASDGQIAQHDPDSCPPLFGSLCQLIESALLPRAASLITYSYLNKNAWEKSLNCPVHYCPPPLLVESSQVSWQPCTEHGLVIGRVQEWKGPRTLCEALGGLGDNAPCIDWYGRVIISQRSGVPLDIQLMRDYPGIWGHRIIHYAPVAPSLIIEKQREASFFLVPSDWDVFNYTAAEAMASGCPVICSEGAGASELIQHGQNGFLFTAIDSASLEESLREIMALSFKQKQIIGTNARDSVANLLNPNHIAHQTLSHYQSVASAPRAQWSGKDSLLSSLFPITSPDSFSSLSRDLDRLDSKRLIRHCSRRIMHKLSQIISR